MTASHALDAADDVRFDALLERSSLGASGARQLRERTPLAAAETISRLSAPEEFEDFFRASFRPLVRTAMYAGATFQEAEDAAAKTLAEMLPAWPVGRPLSYARAAVLHNFFKDRTRGNRRVARRLIDRGHVPRHEGYEDDRLTSWEDTQWVADVLSVLPPSQRKVMECIAGGLDREEIAKELGMSKAVVRRDLCDARARLARLLHPDGEPTRPP